MIILALATVGAFSIIYFTFKNGISPMPSSKWAIEVMVDLTQKGDPKVIHELGCGWGGLALALAKGVPSAQVIAIENSWLPWLISWLRLRGQQNVTLVYGNFMKMDLSQCEWVVTYQFRRGMQELAGKLNAGVLVSNTFAINGIEPIQAVRDQDVIYLYRIK